MLLEHYVTLFNDNDEDFEKKKQYLDQVWDVLQSSYAPIGGIANMSDPEDLLDDEFMWKLVTRGEKVVAVTICKYSGNDRKLVCGGSDGTPQGKKDFYKLCQEDADRVERNSWAEVSGSMEGVFLFKLNGVPIPVDIAKKILADRGKEIISTSKDGFHYTRDIGGKPYEKIMIGNVPEKYRDNDWNKSKNDYKKEFQDYVKAHPEEVEQRKNAHKKK
jgi:hypothetical protein